MDDSVYVLGNGLSRKNIDPYKLEGTVVGCNACYRDFEPDILCAIDAVIIFDGRPARVVRVGIWKTILFVYEVGCANGKAYVKGGNKVAVQNDKLKEHMIEQPLPMLDLKKWDDCVDE